MLFSEGMSFLVKTDVVRNSPRFSMGLCFIAATDGLCTCDIGCLGSPVVPFYPFFLGGGSLIKTE